MATINIRQTDRQIVRTILREVGRYGEPVSEVARMCNVSVQRIVAVVRRYEGIRFVGGTIVYTPAENGSWKKSMPGIANPRTGICGRIAAEVAVIKKRNGKPG